MRYFLVPMLVILAVVLLREALGALRRAMRRTIQPARDVFLLGETSAGAGLLNLPLFPVTTIGRSPSCDVRILDDSIAQRHAMVYLFDGDWFLRPLSSCPVSINGVRIQSPTPLEDHDELLLGERRLTFMYAPEYTRLMAEREAWANAADARGNTSRERGFRPDHDRGFVPRPPPPSQYTGPFRPFGQTGPVRPADAADPFRRDTSAPDAAGPAAAPPPSAQTRATGSQQAVNRNPFDDIDAELDGDEPDGRTAYGQPAYGQPAYGQPAYGQAAYGADVDEPTSYARPPLPAPALVQRLPGSAWLLFNLLMFSGLGISILLIPDALGPVFHAVSLWYVAFFVLGNLYMIVLPRVLKGLDPTLLLCFLVLTWLGLVIQTRLAIPESLMVREAVFSRGWLDRLGGDIQTITRTIGAVFGGPGPVAETGLNAETLERIGDIFANINAQYVSIAIGIALIPLVAVFVARTRMVELFIPLCAILTPLMLLATLVLGNGADSHGATLWINIGGFSLQLTEFAKITYLIVLAGFFKNRPSRRMQLFFALWAGFVFFLIMLLPDLGSAMILLPTTILVYVVMTSEYITTLLIMIGGTGVSVMAYAIFPHVRRRIIGWTTLWTQVNDSNRQIVYGLQAMVRGGLFGRGLGNGSPGGIPLASSDMIFSVVCEEFGLITGLVIVGLFIIIWLRATRITVLAPDGFRSSLALAIGTMLFVEAIVVIAGTTGLMPLTGATLPMIAKGGSSALAKLLLLGILLGLSVQPRERSARERRVSA